MHLERLSSCVSPLKMASCANKLGRIKHGAQIDFSNPVMSIVYLASVSLVDSAYSDIKEILVSCMSDNLKQGWHLGLCFVSYQTKQFTLLQ